MAEKLGPYELNQIVTGDARELAESIWLANPGIKPTPKGARG
jgi:hypothetical protein